MVDVIPPLELSERDQSSNIVCVNLYDLNRVLSVLSKMQEFMCELQDKQYTDSDLLTSVSDTVKTLVKSVSNIDKLSDEHQSDIDYIYKKINLHGCKQRVFFRDIDCMLKLVGSFSSIGLLIILGIFLYNYKF